MSDDKIQSVLGFMSWKQDMVLKAKTTQKIKEHYCHFIVKFVHMYIKIPQKEEFCPVGYTVLHVVNQIIQKCQEWMVIWPIEHTQCV